MITAIVQFCDAVAKGLMRVCMLLLVALIGITLYEVVSRYVFAAPTLWAFDASFMVNGALFMLGAAFTLMANEHVRIDVFSARMPAPIQRTVGIGFYLLLFLPVIGLLTYVAVAQTWLAYVTDDRVLESAWRPYKWPFYLPLAVGLAAFWLQSLAQALRLLFNLGTAELART